LKIVFAGTPEFALTALGALHQTDHKIVAVYTQPDRPAGRGRKLTASPVKQFASEHGIPVYQPATLRDAEAQAILASHHADLMIVVAYGLIIPAAVLTMPQYGCMNIHASLLPRWRGAAPIQRAILAGDEEAGVTIMQMDEGLDTGDMLLKMSCPIHTDDTAASLHDRLAELGAKAMLETLITMQAGQLQPEPQDDSLSCYAAKLNKAEAQIDWQLSATELDRQIRAFNPWPVSQTTWQHKTLRIWQAELVDESSDLPVATVLQTSSAGIDVVTGNGVLRLTKIQLSGGKPMSASAFLNAHSLEGARLGT